MGEVSLDWLGSFTDGTDTRCEWGGGVLEEMTWEAHA